MTDREAILFLLSELRLIERLAVGGAHDVRRRYGESLAAKELDAIALRAGLAQEAVTTGTRAGESAAA